MERDAVLGTFLVGNWAADFLTCHERLAWLMRAVSVPDILPVAPGERSSARQSVREMNNLAGEPLAQWVDGRTTSGFRLTPIGRRLSVALVAIQQEQRRLLERFGAPFADDLKLLERVAVRTSARNQFVAKVTGVRNGQLQEDVVLELAGARSIVAAVTSSSVDSLGLVVGKDVFALVKASAVRVLEGPDDPRGLGCNRLAGIVAAVQRDKSNTELTIDLGVALSAVSLLRTPQGAVLNEGDKVTIAFHPSSVLIGVSS